jgi:hypothetical protein
MRRIFATIHATDGWGGGESRSGPGSSRERAAAFLPELIALVRSLGTSTLLDVPCGDFNWAQPLADAVGSYIGVDIVPALVKSNRGRWSSARRTFLCRDMLTQRLPPADLVLCRDALVHLSESDARLAIANLARTRARYLIATTFIGDRVNSDIATGEWRPLNLQRPPFSFPPPLELIDERCLHTGGIYADKRLALWRFEDLAKG